MPNVSGVCQPLLQSFGLAAMPIHLWCGPVLSDDRLALKYCNENVQKGDSHERSEKTIQILIQK